MTKLTEKQVAKVNAIVDKANFDEAPGFVNIFEPAEVKAARKIYARKLDGCDKILAIIAPPKPKVRKIGGTSI